MHAADCGIEDAQGFGHVLFGFGAFFKGREFDIHPGIIAGVVRRRHTHRPIIEGRPDNGSRRPKSAQTRWLRSTLSSINPTSRRQMLHMTM